jgi:hypothetical protein
MEEDSGVSAEQTREFKEQARRAARQQPPG